MLRVRIVSIMPGSVTGSQALRRISLRTFCMSPVIRAPMMSCITKFFLTHSRLYPPTCTYTPSTLNLKALNPKPPYKAVKHRKDQCMHSSAQILQARKSSFRGLGFRGIQFGAARWLVSWVSRSCLNENPEDSTKSSEP